MSEEKARKTIEKYIEAFNAQDVTAMVDKLNFPFSWIINNRVRPVQKASDFVPPTDELIKREGGITPNSIWLNRFRFGIPRRISKWLTVVLRPMVRNTLPTKPCGSLPRITVTGEFSACLYIFLECTECERVPR